MARCPNCTSPLALSDTKCNRCGAIFDAGSAWAPREDPSEQTRSTSAQVSIEKFVALLVATILASAVVPIGIVIFAWGFNRVAALIPAAAGYLVGFAIGNWNEHSSRALAFASAIVPITCGVAAILSDAREPVSWVMLLSAIPVVAGVLFGARAREGGNAT